MNEYIVDNPYAHYNEKKAIKMRKKVINWYNQTIDKSFKHQGKISIISYRISKEELKE